MEECPSKLLVGIPFNFISSFEGLRRAHTLYYELGFQSEGFKYIRFIVFGPNCKIVVPRFP